MEDDEIAESCKEYSNEIYKAGDGNIITDESTNQVIFYILIPPLKLEVKMT